MYKAKRSHAELIKLRKTAKYLVIIKGMPQKEVAKIVGVSEKTMSRQTIELGMP